MGARNRSGPADVRSGMTRFSTCRRPVAAFVALLLAGSALAACSSDGADVGAGQSGAETCPPATAPRPEGGWLGDGPERAPVVPGLQPAPDTSAADALAQAALTELGARYAVRDSSVVESPDCPDRPPVLRVELAAPDGGTVIIVTERLTGPLFWMEEPVAGEVERRSLPDGTEVALNDFDGKGIYRRAWAARPDGTFVRVSAIGTNAPSQAGWPTTMATMPSGTGTSVPPSAAPLKMKEVEALALALLPA